MDCQLGVNFINIKRTNFLYNCRVSAAFSSYMYVEKQRSYEKFVRLSLMKFTTAWFKKLLRQILPAVNISEIYKL